MKEKLIEYLKRVGELNYLVTTLRWEMDTQAPKKSYDYLINVSAKYELEAFNLLSSDEYINLINDLINSDEFSTLSCEEQIYIKDLKEEYYKYKKIPKSFYEEFCKLKRNSLATWVVAKEKNDYEIFKPFLKDIIYSTKRFYSFIYPNATNLYNCMLSDYEKGIDSSLIDKLFDELKKSLIPIVKNLNEKKKTKLNIHLEDSKFIEFARFLLDYIGFDNNRGALGIYTHGYTIKLNNDDFRITFSNRDNPIDSISTIVHEGGHGIFEQNVSKSLTQYDNYEVNKYALHESQSRFFENILGRRKSFFVPIYDDIKKYLNIDMSIEEFVECFNNAQASLVRTEADELTYCLHIIIRYEIEREIFNGNIDLNKLPEIWNSKYQEYLGVSSDNYSQGILQDMHWADGSFGYFPSYLLGSIFDGMLLEQINKDLGDIDTVLSVGRIKDITKYLTDKIHKFGGSYNVNEVANRVCGKDLCVEPIIKYFKDKYE